MKKHSGQPATRRGGEIGAPLVQQLENILQGIVEVGKGPELVARGGVYAGLYHSANLGG